MKTLMNQKLLIDSECPMCNFYGNAFEKYSFVEKNTCLPFQYSISNFQNIIDIKRAQNEIALVDIKENKVVYGVDAFLKILEVQLPILVNFLRTKWIYFFFLKVYKFISQNRKVIAPSQWSNRTCVPELNIKYRIAYFIMVAVFSSIVIFNFTQSINVFWGWKSNYYRELLICFGQIIWQAFFLKSVLKEKIWDYLGNMSTVSLLGSFLLIPLLIVADTWVIFKMLYFGFIVSFMLFEHVKRCKVLELSFLPSISWVVYRTVILALIIFLK
ncbi:hypothetical protein EGI22_20945 [Lacihabitans sp. LS3-19]|uniref:hypothetical protein n=1 Tax=Lacihabitans sp. LS3-19 TaxID=2487335 RepID=UPI0020CFACA4|nr:hypothetical protein [Lacihabitans sp. LS3-19]MCP9770382.1 hypothetical protein [Lacihabitans sp. LS3-19]